MKFSERWLRTWVNTSVAVDALAEQFTQIGLEVESIADGNIIELAIPPNRGDCLSMQGIARELAALNREPLLTPKIAEIAETSTEVLAITVQTPAACPKYLARSIKNINAQAKTPDWMQKILTEAGINSISAVVDVTNYVMLELGQPMHAFNLNALANEIIVRKAKAGEKLVLLDGTELTLTADDLVIADKNAALALAGIMGGLGSAVTADCQDILLECAYFSPIGIRLTARQHGLTTDSAYRIERGVDINLQELALARASNLLQEIVGGQMSVVTSVITASELPAPSQIYLRSARIKKILSIYPGDDVVLDILTRLGMQCTVRDAGWNIVVPSYRSDLTLEIDLIEELARFIGYQSIPTLMPQTTLDFKEHKESEISAGKLKSCLQSRGYTEVITYSFIAPDAASMFSEAAAQLQLINPISADMAVMRPSLFPGLVKVLQYNENRQCNRVRIFELGLKFVVDKDQQLQQEQVLAGLAWGPLHLEHWDGKSKPHDFFDLKGDVEAVCKLAAIDKLRYEPIEDAALHPGKSAAIFTAGRYLGCIGELHPKLLKALGFTSPVVVFELNYKALLTGSIAKFCSISKFPGIRRDLAIIVDQAIIAQDITDTVKELAGELLQDFSIFDIYSGQGIEHGKKSVGIGIVLQHPARTLVEEEIKQVMDNIMHGLQLKFNATLR